MPQDSRSVSFATTSANPPVTPGRSYILCIGIDRYQHLPKLSNAVKDAQEVTQLLVSKYQFNEADVSCLFDDQATQKNIFQAFSTLIRIVKPEDIVLIYFSGHGILQNDISEGYWIPVDGERDNPGSYIANSLIVNYLRNIKSLHTFIISDSCFSGSMFMGESTRDFAERQETIPSRWLMTSGRDTPVLDGAPGKNSPFADSILLHLQHNNREVLPVTALFRSVSEDVGNNFDQLPRCEPLQNVGHRGGEFALRLKGSVAPPIRVTPTPPQDTFRVLPGRSSFPWQRIALWAIGAVAVAAAHLIGYNYMFGVAEPEKTMLVAKTAAIPLGEIPVNTSKSFVFEVLNKGNVTARVNNIQGSCTNIKLMDSAKAIILAGRSRIYRVEWQGDALPGVKQCQILLDGDNLSEQVRIDVTATVTAVGETVTQNTGPAPGPESATSNKAQLEALTPVIDLKNVKLGSERTFAFKIQNLSAMAASVNPVISSCNFLAAAKGGGGNTIAAKGLGSYGGVWKATQLGQQQCTLTIGGTNLQRPVTIMVKANVEVPGPGPGNIPPPSVKKAVHCLTHGVGGIKVWFYDADGLKYEKTSVAGEDDVVFNIPKEMAGQTVEVNYKKGSKEDHRDQVLSTAEPFEVPLGIRN